MSGLNHHVIRKSLIRRVFNFASQNTTTGLVAEFGRRTRWLRTPVEARTVSNNVRSLHVFLRAIDCKPLQEDLTKFFAFLKNNEGNHKLVRALNILEERSGSERRWRDNPSL